MTAVSEEQLKTWKIIVENSGLFDAEYYLQANPDVAASGMDPLKHYLEFGRLEGRPINSNASPEFTFNMKSSNDIERQLLTYNKEKISNYVTSYAINNDDTNRNDYLGNDISINLNRQDINKSYLVIGIILFRPKLSEIKKLHDSIKNSYIDDLTNLGIYIFLNSEVDEEVYDYLSEENIEIFGNKENIGFGRAHNYMMAMAFNNGAGYYLALNPDGILHPNCISSLLKTANQKDGNCLVEAIQFPKEHPKPYDPYTGVTPWCSGACLLISFEIFLITKGFDDQIFMYCEDVDLSWRARLNGFDCILDQTAIFFHDVIEKKNPNISKMMLTSAKYLGEKWGSKEFASEIENLLIRDGYYPDKTYIKSIKVLNAINSPKSNEICEWRQMLSFCTPRW